MTHKWNLLALCAAFLAAMPAQANQEDPTHLRGRSVAPMDCLPAALRVYHELPDAPTVLWKKLISARYGDGRTNHVYCVFRLGEAFYAYDNTWGSRKVHPADLSAKSVAQAIDFAAVYGVYLN